MKTVPLYGKIAAGRVALISDCRWDSISQYRWWVSEPPGKAGRRGGPYAYTHVRWPDGTRHTIYMHTLITGYARTDHIDHYGLNNQDENLRRATGRQNGANQRKQARATSSRYKGVTWVARRGLWQAQIRHGGRRRFLGYHVTEEGAARAYNAAALEAFGEYALLNVIA